MFELPLDDIQGIIVRGYTYRFAQFIFVQINDAVKGREWLKGLLDSITPATMWPKHLKPNTALNVAFTCAGLKALGLADETLETFLPEFQHGIGKSADVLGDIKESHPDAWEIGGTNQPSIHAALMVYGATSEQLGEFASQLYAGIEKTQNGVTMIACEDAARLTGDREHFGYVDGISQPAIEGSKKDLLPGQKRFIKAGEFVLGYPNEYDVIPPSPTLKAADVQQSLKLKNDDFGLNGTYLVYRKLHQDVYGFWNFIYAHANSEEEAEHLAAKLMGRWRSGTPLPLSPDRDDPAMGKDKMRNNNFDFKPDDAAGYGCPLGSHMRRANPRNSFEDDPAESVIAVDRHRVIRRAMPFGPAMEDFKVDDGQERGLHFWIVNANINRQFEFVQQSWLNDPKFNGLYDNKDPIVGDNYGDGHMVIQRAPFRKRIGGFPRFVTVRGGGYFFMPSMTALRWLAGG